MEAIIVFLIVLSACSFVFLKALNKKKQSKCSDCSATSCSTCPLVTNSALQTHLKARKEANHS